MKHDVPLIHTYNGTSKSPPSTYIVLTTQFDLQAKSSAHIGRIMAANWRYLLYIIRGVVPCPLEGSGLGVVIKCKPEGL